LTRRIEAGGRLEENQADKIQNHGATIKNGFDEMRNHITKENLEREKWESNSKAIESLTRRIEAGGRLEENQADKIRNHGATIKNGFDEMRNHITKENLEREKWEKEKSVPK
jgi:hypothetical protein